MNVGLKILGFGSGVATVCLISVPESSSAFEQIANSTIFCKWRKSQYHRADNARMTMRAVALKESLISAEALFVSDSVDYPPAPGKDQAIVKVAYFGLNRMDIMQRQGTYPVPTGAPNTLGVEFSGSIVTIGDGTESPLQIGDVVFGLVAGGAYAEYVLCSTKLLMKYETPSAESTFTQLSAGGAPEVWFTATQALLKIARIHENKDRVKCVLIHAGASGVGIAGLQLARAVLGPEAQIFATVGSDEKVRFVESVMGATKGINYKKYDFAKVILEYTSGAGADVVVDFIGQEYFMRNIAVAAMDAHIVMLSLMSGSVVDGRVDIAGILRKRLTIQGSTLRSRTIAYQSDVRALFETYGLPGLVRGEFVNPVDKVFAWTSVADAHRYMESNVSMGKIMCVVE
ncbi:uncharacterized protein V1518DRAFT_408819 [Limtongia smithiae]|uniref:uncharacterized protein n=1 Tax=Limtongia smithiae TaxID=1125753 RepID=UPI0034CDA8D7